MFLFRINYTIRKVSFIRNSSNFVSCIPKYDPVDEIDLINLKEFISNNSKICILTGAGISTESGIPDYRSAGVGLYERTNHKPVQFPDFIRSAEVRRRYWARNYVGWPGFSQRQPNINHKAVCDLELKHKKVSIIITQNVDKLHHKAGSKNVIELHGSGYQVKCLKCDYSVERHEFQKTLDHLNPNMFATSSAIRPDGDVELSQEYIENFILPDCPKCTYGMLKPDIVFFGDNIPRKRAVAVTNSVDASDSLLVLGSSLTVFSSYRIILQAAELNIPIAIVNIGKTRGDNLANLKISTKCGDILSSFCSEL